ncbi:uncharacterized protein [Paramisgurnus dabryanus]|uniref:uncharacterized protein n=1 Tax=Paramisgurnus dabryanus TaxID=90735 RepID=UPI0031F374F1
MLLILFICLQFLEVQPQSLPQAKLTVSPASVTDGEMHFVCEGFKRRRVSECMFYPSGQENFTKPSACNISITISDLIAWSRDHESSHVNIVCYYTVFELRKHITSPHSDKVSVRVRGSAVTPSVSPITENRSTIIFPSQTSQAALPTVLTPFTMDITTYTSSLKTRNRHVLMDPAYKVTETNKYFNTKMLFSVMVASAGGGLVLVGLMVICMYRCKKRPVAKRIWFESDSIKRGGDSTPMVGSGSCKDNEAVYYSSIDVLPSTDELSGIGDEQSEQTEVDLSQLYATVTKPATNDRSDIYSVPMP